jgi:hypothetical protein
MTTTEATWLHLSIAHGFGDWTEEELADHYPSFARPDGRVDVAGLHERDHREHAGEFDLAHDHQEEP